MNLPHIDLNKLGNHVKEFDPDEFDIYNVVRNWIINNLMENPPEQYIKAAINGLIDEKLI